MYGAIPRQMEAQMKYIVEMWLLGKWEYQTMTDTARMAELIATGIRARWAAFNVQVRVREIE